MERKLPIKVVMSRKSDIKSNKGMGSDKFFGECTPEVKKNIINKFESLLSYYDDVFEENIPAVGKIKVKDEAIAKSHKPSRLCKECSIIGGEGLDEIYIKLTRESIIDTIKDLKSSEAKKLNANITAIEDITPISYMDKIDQQLKSLIEQNNIEEIYDSIKIKLFDFGNDFDNITIERYVISKLGELNLQVKEIRYSDRIKFLKVVIKSAEDIEAMATINGIRCIDFFPSYTSIDNTDEQTDLSLEIPQYTQDIDVVIGIIDGGISPNNPYIKDYIYKVEQYVADEYINYSHGTFIASTIQYGNYLNDIEGDSIVRYKFLDVIALPNSNPNAGKVDKINEADLMDIIEEVVGKYHDEVKVWNLSLGIPNKVCNGTISDFAVFCDYIQEKYNVQFIISSGNYLGPQRQWPSQLGNSDIDRIISPADSIRAITVGSIALKESQNSIVKSNEPSSFSRRGPGANYTIKPDVVDFGGNLSLSEECNEVKMVGLDPFGNITYGIGTSYAAPRGSRKYANILNELTNTNLLLAKGLFIHSANLSSKKDYSLSREDIKYYGFGVAAHNTEDFMLCTDHEVTLVFQQNIGIGTHLELFDFPYPKSLIKNGKCYGEIFMTLVYNPPLNSNYGHEYCRANIDVSLGTYKFTGEGKVEFKGQVPLEKTWDSKFEAEQVENGFKWSPVKSYYRNMTKGILEQQGWKLRIDMSPRFNELITSQEFALIITIRDTSEEEDIYTDVITELRNNGYITNDLQLKSQVRQRN